MKTQLDLRYSGTFIVETRPDSIQIA